MTYHLDIPMDVMVMHVLQYMRDLGELEKCRLTENL